MILGRPTLDSPASEFLTGLSDRGTAGKLDASVLATTDRQQTTKSATILRHNWPDSVLDEDTGASSASSTDEFRKNQDPKLKP